MNDPKPPLEATLRKYGLTADQWLEILKNQGYVCPICEKEPSTGKWNIDHDHVKGWKKMPPEQRRQHVRGVLCKFCNRYYMGKAITIQKAHNVVRYLEAYALRGEPPF